MEEYSGMYGKGFTYGNCLHLVIPRDPIYGGGNLTLLRYKNSGAYGVTYDVMASNSEIDIMLLEDCSLRKWREFFVEYVRDNGMELEASLAAAENSRYADC